MPCSGDAVGYFAGAVCTGLGCPLKTVTLPFAEMTPWPPPGSTTLPFGVTYPPPGRFLNMTGLFDYELGYFGASNAALDSQWASAELRADQEVVLAVVQSSFWTIEFASAESSRIARWCWRHSAGGLAGRLQADREVMLAAVQRNGRVLLWASPELQADRDVVTATAQNDGAALESAAPELRVQAMMQRHGDALQWASALQRSYRQTAKSCWQHLDSAAAICGSTVSASLHILGCVL